MNRNGWIDGVKVTPKKKIYDDRGAIFHMLRCDDEEFQKFGEIYFSLVYPNVVKAWHYHTEMWLNYMLVTGAARFVLFDDRPESPSNGVTQEIFLHPENSVLVTVPPKVWNGFKGVGASVSIIANCTTITHRKDEISRRPFDDAYFNYDWSQRHG